MSVTSASRPLLALALALAAALATAPRASAGDRPDIYSFTAPQRADLAAQMADYITTEIVYVHLDPPVNKHGSARFLPWHRDYLKGLEDYLISQNRPQFVPLPKWDPMTPIPPEFTNIDPDCPGDADPLVDLDPMYPLPADLGANLCAQTDFNSFRFYLESLYHGYVHVEIGGTMATYSSPGAPIFWLWHAYVDDIWFDWQCLCGLDEGGAFAPYTSAEKATDLLAGTADAWMQDSIDDYGAEPNDETSTFWQSKDIWVRNDPATPVGPERFLNEHQHQNPFYDPVPAERPYIYVKMRNRGCTTISGNLHVYYSNVAVGTIWPFDFTEVSTSPIPLTIEAGRDHVGELQWLNIPDPSGPGGPYHTLLARFVASPTSADPINGEFMGVIAASNAKASNQIAFKGVTIADSSNPWGIWLTASAAPATIRLEFDGPPDGGGSYLERLPAEIDLGPVLHQRWLSAGAPGTGVSATPVGTVRILQEGASIDGLPLFPGEDFEASLTFGSITACADDDTTFAMRVRSFDGQTLLGGQTFEVPADTVLASPEVVVEAQGSPIECVAGFVPLRLATGLPQGASAQWLLDGAPIAGATGMSTAALESGFYSAIVTTANGCDRSSLPVYVHVDGAPNDEPCNATPLTLDHHATFELFCATASAGEVSPAAGTGPESCESQDGWCAWDTDVQNSVWYTFTAPPSGLVSVRVDTHHHATPHGLLGNTQLALYEATDCSDYTTYHLVAANDDSVDQGAWGSAPALEGLALTPGAIYLLQLDGNRGQNAAGTLVVEDDTPPLATPGCFGTGCPCGNDDPAAGCVHSGGVGGRLEASGSTSVSANDLRLDAFQPVGNSGLLLVHTSLDAPLAVFDGLNCVRGGPRTLPGADLGGTQPFGDVDLVANDGVRNLGSTTAGAGLFGLVNATFPGTFSVPGVTHHAQFWFRDVLCGPPPAPCPSPCGQGSNLTHSLSFVTSP